VPARVGVGTVGSADLWQGVVSAEIVADLVDKGMVGCLILAHDRKRPGGEGGRDRSHEVTHPGNISGIGPTGQQYDQIGPVG